MTWPSISCVMATKDRPAMAARALSQFALQDYPGDREMVVVDSGEEPLPDEFRDLPKDLGVRVRYVQMRPDTPLGVALSEGVLVSTAPLIHKWDDDDLYGPAFLTESVSAFDGAAVVWSRFLVLTLDGITRLCANGMLGGGSIVADRKALDRDYPFPHVSARVDAALLEELEARRGRESVVRIGNRPDLYTAVRHGGNMWKTIHTVCREGPVEIPLDTVLGMLPVWKGGRS